MSWITVRITLAQWEADVMQQMLASHNIPSRIVNNGVSYHFGCSSPASLQVRRQDRWTAMLLLSPIEEDDAES